MLASGRAVIATCNADTEIANVVAQCGLVVAPEDSNALADAIRKLVDDDKARLQFGKEARLYAENNLAKDSVLGRLVEHLQ
jgi:colanic acid biosynthesis glycosyl transferase WcaI